MSSYKIDVAQRKTIVGEGPHWSVDRQELYFVDITGKSVHRHNPATGENAKIELDGKVSLVIPTESDPNKFIVAIERDLSVLQWNGISSTPTSLTKLCTVDVQTPTNRFNDGKCDNQGRVWAGTMGAETKPGGSVDPKKGALYKLDLNGNLSKHLDQIDIANGLTWTTDSSIMYYIDSLTYRVDALKFDASAGTISDRRPVFDLQSNGVKGIPDGMTIDTNGNLWVALFHGSKIIHIDASVGKLISSIDMPTKNITSVTFGGPNLDILYATSALASLSDAELAAQPDAGCLFKITNVGAKGTSGGFRYKGSIST